MGRTVPSFRIAETQEFTDWREFRKALSRRERPIFDEMLNTSRLYTSASSAAVRTSRFEGMAMAIIFHHRKLLEECVDALEKRKVLRRNLISILPSFNAGNNDGHGESIQQVPGGHTRKASEGRQHQPWR
jgi:hypothetical protein